MNNKLFVTWMGNEDGYRHVVGTESDGHVVDRNEEGDGQYMLCLTIL